MTSTTMNALQFKFGGDNFIVNDIPKPTPAADQVLIKVKYSALDTAHDAILKKEMTGYFTHAMKQPLYLGYHYSGTVERLGSEVTDLTPGTPVFGHLQYEPSQRQGSFSEYIVVKRQECAIQPPGVSHSTAAASTTESVTALQAVRDLGGLKPGHSILIVGAAGGVGHAAVQIAKLLGAASVTAVCSSKDVDRVRELGADIVVDRTANPKYAKTMLKEGKRFHVILDAANALPASATKLLAPKGTLVNTIPTLTFVWNKVKTIFSSKKVSFVECRSIQKDLDLLGQWLSSGDLLIPIDSTYPVKEMAAAMEKQNGRKNGRVVIQVEDGW